MEMSEQSSSMENKKSAVERLKDLKDLLDFGAISQEDYDSKKKSILEEL